VLIKGADALERLATPGVMFLDKTGTLTEGRLAVVSWRGDVDAAALASAVESGSQHPIARALCRHADAPEPARDIREQLGRGLAGTVGNRRISVGSPGWIGDASVQAWVADVAARGETPVAIAVDGRCV